MNMFQALNIGVYFSKIQPTVEYCLSNDKQQRLLQSLKSHKKVMRKSAKGGGRRHEACF